MVSEGRAIDASGVLRAAALGVGSVVFGLGWVGSATASAAEPATEPTQQELIQQIKSLQSKVDQLEARQRQRDDQAPPPATTQKDATVDSVLKDAERRSGPPAMLQAEGFTAGYS